MYEISICFESVRLSSQTGGVCNREERSFVRLALYKMLVQLSVFLIAQLPLKQETVSISVEKMLWLRARNVKNYMGRKKGLGHIMTHVDTVPC